MSSSPTATPPARGRHVRPSSLRAHLPTRSKATRSHGLPSPRRVLAAQVIAWHNAHPLARRIGRHQLGGYGVISLPFSPPAEGEAAAEAPGRFAMFDDLSMIKGIPRHKVVALALSDGWEERPGAPEWPLRDVRVARGWSESRTRRIYLLTVAIKRGGQRPPLRVLIGRHGPGAQGAGIVGQRLLSRPRMALVALVLSLPLIGLGWGVQSLWQGWRGSRPAAPLVAEALYNTMPATSPAPAPVVAAPKGAPPPAAGMFDSPTAAPRPAPDDILPAPSGTSARARSGPRVGSGTSLQGSESRKGDSPELFRLVGAPHQDPQVLRNQAIQLQAALQSMGSMGSRLRMDVIGTPDGDALSVGPIGDPGEADRIARRLAARGLTLRVTEQ